MAHANARLNPYGRLLLGARIVEGRPPVAHVAKEMGVSRRCAHGGLPGTAPKVRPVCWTAPPGRTVAHAHAGRGRAAGPELRRANGADRTGSAPTRVTGPHRLRDPEPPRHALAARVRPADRPAHPGLEDHRDRYEHDHPGDLVHIDVKKLGRIPDGGGWRAHGREAAADQRGRLRLRPRRGRRPLPAGLRRDPRRQKGPTCAGFLLRAAAWFAGHGIDRPTSHHRQRPQLHRLHATSPPPSPTSAPSTRSSARTAPGRTGKSSASTAPSSNGPTDRSTSPTPNAARPWPPGSTSTTLNAATQPSAANPRSADCHEPVSRVHLERAADGVGWVCWALQGTSAEHRDGRGTQPDQNREDGPEQEEGEREPAQDCESGSTPGAAGHDRKAHGTGEQRAQRTGARRPCRSRRRTTSQTHWRG